MLEIRRAQVVLILFGFLVPTLCCDWLRQYMDLSDECLSKLQNLGGPVTNEEFQLPFPRKLYRQAKKSQAACKWMFIRDNLGHILDLYQDLDALRVGWDANNLEDLLVLLDRQKTELSECISAVKTRCDWSKPLQRYYTRLSNVTLNGTEGSSAQWELIRSETKMHLERLHLLVAGAT
nr:interferon a3-like [Nerophis lumbriciformis]